MKRTFLLCVSAACLLAACDRSQISAKTEVTTDEKGELRAVAALACPEQQGPLTRVKTAPDGLSCDYAGPRGSQVTLRLVRLAEGTEAQAALAPIETELQRLVPRAAQAAARAEAQANAEAAQADAQARQAEQAGARAEADANAAEEQARTNVTLPGMTVRTEGENARVRMPGISVDAEGDRARVKIFGMEIDANDASGAVNITTDDESVTVNGADEAAEIRTLSKGGDFRSTYMLVDEQAGTDGWRLVGYEARGPAAGPIVTAVVRVRDRKEDEVFDAAKALVEHNVGR